MPVLLTNRQRRFAVDLPTLMAWADTCLAALGRAHMELSVLLVNDPAMRRLNAQFRGLRKTTDVLSFPQLDGDDGDYGNDPWETAPGGESATEPVPGEPLGDIVISVQTAHRQAAMHGIPVAAELALLLVHGILHLTGHDHEQGPEEAARMAAAEGDLLHRLGFDRAGLVQRADADPSDMATPISAAAHHPSPA